MTSTKPFLMIIPDTQTCDCAAANTRNNEVLEKLATIPGYEYSFISGSDGKLLAFHKSDDLSSNVEEAISSAISWINASKANAEELHLEKMEFILIEYEKGSLNVQWSDVNLNYFIAASFDKKW